MKYARIIAMLGALSLLAACAAPPESDWRVVATAAGERKIDAIKAIRELTVLGLKDAKDLVDHVPSVILTGLPQSKAEAAAERLREAGMTVQVQAR